MFKIIEYIVRLIEILSVIILLSGLALNFKEMMYAVLAKDIVRIKSVKNKIGIIVLLGMEILIVADIIETALNPTWEDILSLGTIVIIRTITSYFLNKELDENFENREDYL